MGSGSLAKGLAKLGRRLLVAVGGLGALNTMAATSEFALPAGEYAIHSNMVMPHLDEMRRIIAEDSRCLAKDNAPALFPVMRQPALRGCTFGFGEVRDQSLHYVLVCQTALVATGTAELTRRGGRIIGNLVVKMGGKNMTFAQRVEAVRAGDCQRVPP
jgi:hypothetical protein